MQMYFRHCFLAIVQNNARFQHQEKTQWKKCIFCFQQSHNHVTIYLRIVRNISLTNFEYSADIVQQNITIYTPCFANIDKNKTYFRCWWQYNLLTGILNTKFMQVDQM